MNNKSTPQQIVIPSLEQHEGRTLLDYGDSAVAIIVAISFLIGAIAELIKVLVPVMMERSEKGGK